MSNDGNFGKMVPIEGNTYPVREQLKELGGRWDPEQRVWMVPEIVAADARRLVSSVKPDDAWFRSPVKRSWEDRER